MSVRLRLALWYIVAIGALGTLPYLAVVLRDKGISDPNIALLMAILPMASLFAAPSWAWLADRTGRSRPLVTITTVLTTTGLATVAWASSPWLVFAALVVYAIGRSPQAPIVDELAVRAMGDGGRGYGRVRLWGSLTFLVVAFIAGWLRTLWDVAPLVLGATLLSASIPMSRVLPHMPSEVARPHLRELIQIFTRGYTALLTVMCIFHGVGLAFYDHYFGLHVETLGLPSNVIGTAVVVAVGTEVVVMAVAPILLQRFRPSHLLLLAMVVTVPRWLGTAWVSEPVPLIALQSLHGLSFGLFWVAAVPAFARNANPSVARSAQAVLTATGFGIGPLIATPIAWVLLANHPPATLFYAGAVAALLATLTVIPLTFQPSSPAP